MRQGRKLGGLDILVNNAGTPGEFKSLTESSDQTWDKVINLNLRAAFRLIRAALPLLRQSRHGRIINTSSVCGQMGITFLSAYCASKAGLVGLTRSVAVELGRRAHYRKLHPPGKYRDRTHAWSISKGRN